jgi:DNA processing protein
VAAREAWLRILAAVAPGDTRLRDLLQKLGSAEALLAEPARNLAGLGLGDESIHRLGAPDDALLARWRVWLEGGPDRQLVPFGSPLYPPQLAALDTAPLALWVQGARTELLPAPQLAMVGSRNPTRGGRDTAEEFARYFSTHGLVITSGLATGIDAASHRGALHGVAGTIAVLGSGLDVVFPRTHERLAHEVAEHGLLVSEYGPGVEPRRFHFPQRNRIIAGLALGTLVVEATRRSGSLITARWALDYGREVFAIPGSIHNALARGCHALIRHGAKLVEEASDVFVELAPMLGTLDLAAIPHPDVGRGASETVDPEYEKLFQLLDFSPISLTDLVDRSGLTAAELSSMLLILELEGFVEALPGGRYLRLAKRN